MDIEVTYLVEGGKLVMSMNGQVHAPVSVEAAANLLNDREGLRKIVRELLEAMEFCEAALADHFASEDGLDVEAARRLSWMCSDLLVQHGRSSHLIECGKQPET